MGVLLLFHTLQCFVASAELFLDEVHSLGDVLSALFEVLLDENGTKQFIDLYGSQKERNEIDLIFNSIFAKYFHTHLVFVSQKFQFIQNAVVFVKLTVQQLSLLNHLGEICGSWSTIYC